MMKNNNKSSSHDVKVVNTPPHPVMSSNLYKSLEDNKSKIVPFNTVLHSVGNIRYFPATTSDWKSSVCTYNSNYMKDLPSHNIRVNDLIKNYFNLYFSREFLHERYIHMVKRSRKKRFSLRKIFVSKADVKHTNSKALVNIFIYNKQKKLLYKNAFISVYLYHIMLEFQNYLWPLYNIRVSRVKTKFQNMLKDIKRNRRKLIKRFEMDSNRQRSWWLEVYSFLQSLAEDVKQKEKDTLIWLEKLFKFKLFLRIKRIFLRYRLLHFYKKSFLKKILAKQRRLLLHAPVVRGAYEREGKLTQPSPGGGSPSGGGFASPLHSHSLAPKKTPWRTRMMNILWIRFRSFKNLILINFANATKKLNYNLFLFFRNLKFKFYLNKFKFKYKLLYKLGIYLKKLYNKDIKFNLVSLRSRNFNIDILTSMVTMCITRRETRFGSRAGQIAWNFQKGVKFPAPLRVNERKFITPRGPLALGAEGGGRPQGECNVGFASPHPAAPGARAPGSLPAPEGARVVSALHGGPSRVGRDMAPAAASILENNLTNLNHENYLCENHYHYSDRERENSPPVIFNPNIRVVDVVSRYLESHRGSLASPVEEGRGWIPAPGGGPRDFKNPKFPSLLRTDMVTRNIKKIIFKKIVKYKNNGGIKFEISGRLTRRYRADKAMHIRRIFGGLNNIDSSFKRLSRPLLRGFLNCNVEYSIFTSKRRIGAFAVKGWSAGR